MEDSPRVKITLDLLDYQADQKVKDDLIKAQADVIITLRQSVGLLNGLIELLRKAQT